MRASRKQITASVTAAVILLLLLGFSLFQFVISPTIGYAGATTLTIISGNVMVRQSAQTEFQSVKDGATLNAGDRVRTEDASYAVITFFEGSTVTLDPNTDMTIASLLRGRGNRPTATAIALHQATGVSWSMVMPFADPSSIYQIDTPAGLVLLRGSLLQVTVQPDSGRTDVASYEGLALVRVQGVETELPAYTEITITPGQPPGALRPAPSTTELLRFAVDTTVWARVIDPIGRTVGHIRPGLRVTQVPGSRVSLPFVHPMVLEVPVIESGRYTIVLEGARKGDYRLIVQGLSRESAVFTQGVQGVIEPGQRFIGGLDVSTQGGRIKNGQLGGFASLSTGEGPGKFVRTQAAVAGVPLTATAVLIEGTAIPISTRTATVTPTQTRTPEATATETLSDSPTVTPTIASQQTVTPAATGTPPPILTPVSPTQSSRAP